MGFFTDLKEDLSQAVGELMPEDEILDGLPDELLSDEPLSEEESEEAIDEDAEDLENGDYEDVAAELFDEFEEDVTEADEDVTLAEEAEAEAENVVKFDKAQARILKMAFVHNFTIADNTIHLMGSPISEMDLTSLAWCVEAIRPVQFIHGGTRQTTSLRPTQKSTSFIKLRANTIRSTYWYTLGQNREKLQPQALENRS